MLNPEALIQQREAALAHLLGERDPHILFADELAFIEPYRAGVHPDKFALHRWTSEDGSVVSQFTIRVTQGEDEEHHLCNFQPDSFVIGQARPSHPVIPDEQPMIYRGIVAREDALTEALDWLLLNDDGRDHHSDSRDGMDDIVGFFGNGREVVAVTGIGAAIFGSHIRAMQERSTTSQPSIKELDS